MAPVIVFDIPEQSRLELCHRTEIASLQEPPSKHTEPEFHLIEPGSMGRSEMEHMLVGRICQKGSPLFACLQHRRIERDVAKLSNDTADFQAPVSIKVIQHPVKAHHLREPPGHVIQVRREVHAGPGWSQVPNEFTGRHDERGDQSACPISDVVLLTSLGFAGLSRLSGVGTAQCLHSRLFITANHQSTLLVHQGSLDVQLANLLSLGVEVGVMAVEPVNTPVWFQVGLVKNPPDRRPTHDQVVSSPVDQRGSQVIQRPPRGGTTLLVGRAAGQRDHIEPYRGGKTASVDPTAADLADRSIRSSGSGFATQRRCGDRNETQRRSADCRDGHRRQPEESVGSETPRPEALNRPGPRASDHSVLVDGFPCLKPLTRQFPRGRPDRRSRGAMNPLPSLCH